MKEKYNQPILVIHRFKISDEMMATGTSKPSCHMMWCDPNGWHTDHMCYSNECSGGEGTNYGFSDMM